jgi:uncharacterized protein (TIGR02996 family)
MAIMSEQVRALSEYGAFLRAINAQPDDDTPRLVFADWLDENGDPARAEFIRVQIALARLPEEGRHDSELAVRSRALEDAHQEQWLAEIPTDLYCHTHLGPPDFRPVFRRGFIEEVSLASGSLADIRQALDLFPLQGINITYNPSIPYGELADHSKLQYLRHFGILIEDHEEPSADAPHVRLIDGQPDGLRDLFHAPNFHPASFLMHRGSGEAGYLLIPRVLALLGTVEWGKRLETFRMSGTDELPAAAIVGIHSLPFADTLRHLRIDGPSDDPYVEHPFFDHGRAYPALERLELLRLGATTFFSEEPLETGPHRFPALRHMSLLQGNLQEHEFNRLLRHLPLSQLRTFDLRGNPLRATQILFTTNGLPKLSIFTNHGLILGGTLYKYPENSAFHNHDDVERAMLEERFLLMQRRERQLLEELLRDEE